jgi:hypothetical protein
VKKAEESLIECLHTHQSAVKVRLDALLVSGQAKFKAIPAKAEMTDINICYSIVLHEVWKP